MSNHDSFEQRATALENIFYADVDKKLIDKMREQMAEQDDIAALKEITGLSCDTTLANLRKLGITAQTSAAMRLVPMVEVAWADGKIDEREKKEVLLVASKSGISEESPGGQLLKSWLDRKPTPELMGAWCEYTKALIANLDATSAAKLRESVIDEMKDIAESSGGILGFGSISAGESTVMKRINDALA